MSADAGGPVPVCETTARASGMRQGPRSARRNFPTAGARITSSTKVEPEDRVDPRCKDVDASIGIAPDRELTRAALRPPDPVPAASSAPVRPLLHLACRVHTRRVGRDAKNHCARSASRPACRTASSRRLRPARSRDGCYRPGTISRRLPAIGHPLSYIWMKSHWFHL